MRKKILCILLSIVMAAGMTGCALFEHNYEKDYQQVIVRIRPITETREVLKRNADGEAVNADGEPLGEDESEVYEEKSHTTREWVIYKSELVSSANSNLQSLVQNNGYTVQQAVDYIVEQLVLQKLIINEAEFSIAFGDIEWGLTEENTVKKSIYASIDSQLKTIKNEIREEHGEPVEGSGSGDEEESSTTYPVPDPEEPEDIKDTEAWAPDINRYPGMFGTPDEKSLENEALVRFVQLLKENVESDFRVTKEQKAEFDKEFEQIASIQKTKGVSYIYPYLGGTALINWVIGDTAKNNVKISLLQEYLTDSITISDQDVQDYYDSLKLSQNASYAGGTDAFKTAITSTEAGDPIVYFPNSNYFYVKHVLIPFSEAQTAELKAYKDSKKHTLEEIKQYRAQMVDGIIAYAHKDGEDDKSRIYTARQIFDEIKNTMTQYAGDTPAAKRSAERKFDEFIYKYNTDPGIFKNAKGYALPYKLAEGESDTYMAEFAEAARKMYETLRVGEVYPEMVVTDYGVHVMYLAGKTAPGYKNLKDYETAGQYRTYQDIIRDTLRTKAESSRFSEWQQTRISYYEKLSDETVKDENKIILRYTSRYDDLYKG